MSRMTRARAAELLDRLHAQHPDAHIELLPPFRPAADNLGAGLPAPGSYLVAAPQ